MKDYGIIAREKRQRLELSQKEVAKKAGCHPRTVRAFENDEHKIGLDYVIAIYKVLGLKLVVEG